MSFNRIVAVVLLSVLAVVVRADGPPALKPEVALAITQLQLQRSQQQTRMLVLQQQYTAAQDAVRALDQQITAKLATALRDSGLDDTYTIDNDTLKLIPRPKSNAPPPPGPPTVKGVKP